MFYFLLSIKQYIVLAMLKAKYYKNINLFTFSLPGKYCTKIFSFPPLLNHSGVMEHVTAQLQIPQGAFLL